MWFSQPREDVLKAFEVDPVTGFEQCRSKRETGEVWQEQTGCQGLKEYTGPFLRSIKGHVNLCSPGCCRNNLCHWRIC